MRVHKGVALMLAAAVVALAGCGSSGSNSNTGSSSSGSSSGGGSGAAGAPKHGGSLHRHLEARSGFSRSSARSCTASVTDAGAARPGSRLTRDGSGSALALYISEHGREQN